MRVIGGRAGLVTAAVGLSLVTVAAGPACATASDPIGYSPAKDVVAVAPLAVSVTFGQRLRSAGASLKVIAATGEDVGQGPISTAHRTLRRDLQLGAPGGDYTIRWTAVSAGGHKMSGAFSFTAARSNLAGQNGTGQNGTGTPQQGAPSAVTSGPGAGTVLPTDHALPAIGPTTPGGSTTAVSSTAMSTTTPAASAGAVSSPTAAGSASSASPAPTGSSTGALITMSRPTWVAQAGPARAGSPSDLKNHGLPAGFTAIPLAVAGLLMLSAALIARLKRRIHTP